MRNVLVVLFWLWVLVAVGVYAYRIFRRVAHGPKGAPSPPDGPSGAGTAGGSASDVPAPRKGGLLAGLSTPPPPPLPDGPVEARLPKSLRDRPAPSGAPNTDGPGPEGGAGNGVGIGEGTGPGAVAAPVPAPTLADALQGIRMPDELLPMVDPTDLAAAEGRRARFAGTGTSVPAVATALGDELKRLGYLVDGLDTVTSTRAGLSAQRDGTTVAAAIGLDDDTGAVVVRLSL